jgi:hypothetical protein
MKSSLGGKLTFRLHLMFEKNCTADKLAVEKLCGMSPTRVDFFGKGVDRVYSVWLHRCRDFSVPTPRV